MSYFERVQENNNVSFRLIANYDTDKNVIVINCVVSCIAIIAKATSHSTIFDIPMRPLREDQKHRHRFTW